MPCHMYYLNLRMTKLTLSSEGELSLCEALEKEEKQFLIRFINYDLAEIIMLDPLPLSEKNLKSLSILSLKETKCHCHGR